MMSWLRSLFTPKLPPPQADGIDEPWEPDGFSAPLTADERTTFETRLRDALETIEVMRVAEARSRGQALVFEWACENCVCKRCSKTRERWTAEAQL